MPHSATTTTDHRLQCCHRFPRTRNRLVRVINSIAKVSYYFQMSNYILYLYTSLYASYFQIHPIQDACRTFAVALTHTADYYQQSRYFHHTNDISLAVRITNKKCSKKRKQSKTTQNVPKIIIFIIRK